MDRLLVIKLVRDNKEQGFAEKSGRGPVQQEADLLAGGFKVARVVR